MSTYAVAMSSGMATHDVIRAAARMLLAIIAAGIIIVWPMVRLSQEPDPRPLIGPILDIVVLLVPIQAIIWPQSLPWLGNWSLSVIAAVGATLAAWSVLIGALIAMSHALRARSRSTVSWMAVFVLVVLMGLIPALATSRPASSMVDQPAQVARVSWMASPMTAMFELAQDRTWTGATAAVFPGHWRMIGFTFAAAAVCWLAAIVVRKRTGNRPRPGLH